MCIRMSTLRVFRVKKLKLKFKKIFVKKNFKIQGELENIQSIIKNKTFRKLVSIFKQIKLKFCQKQNLVMP